MRANTNLDGTVSLQTGYDNDEEQPVKHGKKKKKKKLLKVKKAFEDEHVNDDDNF